MPYLQNMPKHTLYWTPLALKTYRSILNQIVEKWGIVPMMKVDTKLNELLNDMKEFGKMCPVSKKKGIHRCVLSKQTSLIYRVNNNQIELLEFIYNRSNHNY